MISSRLEIPALALLLVACDAATPPSETVEITACRIPATLPVAAAATPADDIPDAPVSGYMLALSWSPEFCRFRRTAPEHRAQCRGNRFGLIVHGLWPQSATLPHPRRCALAQPVAEPVLRAHFCMTPDARLINHEWAAHGTCGFASADDYFDTAAAVWRSFAYPDLFALSRENGVTAGRVRGAFAAGDPRLAQAAVGLDVANNGWLREVRLCLNTAFEPRPCTAQEFGPAAETQVAIWRGGRR